MSLFGPIASAERKLPEAPLTRDLRLVREPEAPSRLVRLWSRLREGAAWQIAGVLGIAGLVRLVDLGRFGYNGDEAVYAGQAASLAGNPLFVNQFPIFRAHPLLVPVLMSPLYARGTPDLRGRVVMALFGVALVAGCYLAGRELYNHRSGRLAALLMAVMPYEVTISRQVLLDGPAVAFTVFSLWMLARWVRRGGTLWLASSAALLALAVLSKETMVVMAGGAGAFLLASRRVDHPLKSIAVFGVTLALVSAGGVAALVLSSHAATGGDYIAWQLTRSSNHALAFYLTTVTPAMGLLVVGCAAGALVQRRNGNWQGLLLGSWALAPIIFFQLYPLKGFSYLLPAAPPIALLAARFLRTVRWGGRLSEEGARIARTALSAAIAASLAIGVWATVFSSPASAGMAGTGGLPGGREAGKWVAANLVRGTELMTLGPTMANVIEFYSHYPAQGLSVSTDPLHRNPAYTPISNPDLAVRDGQFSYLVWDAYSAARSPSTSARMSKLLSRYHAHPVYTGRQGGRSVIVIYEVHP
ncbi:MAG: glycosyltransferase family 39 protein [Actinomycetota bacterium]|nr:glycosyltransferase family 39 protein [Actinomycetota bacterium]